ARSKTQQPTPRIMQAYLISLSDSRPPTAIQTFTLSWPRYLSALKLSHFRTRLHVLYGIGKQQLQVHYSSAICKTNSPRPQAVSIVFSSLSLSQPLPRKHYLSLLHPKEAQHAATREMASDILTRTLA
ncbi:hypothetical protein GOP47_0011836, partial [Adiantum capillus-veneris]